MRLDPASIRFVSLVCLVLGTASPVLAVSPSPAGGCPQPPNALVITEFMTGSGPAPRWIEIANPGKYSLSLENVTLTAEEPGTALPPVSFELGELVKALPAGESVAFGFVPGGKPGAEAWLKLKLLDLGIGFNVPLCKGKLTLDGPSGPVDAVQYDLCAGMGGTKGQVWGLDPGYTNACKNDTLSTWCQAPVDGATIGTPGKQNMACDLDGDGYSSAQGDCDDEKKTVHPSGAEVCNGVDEDCNGATDDNVVAAAGVCLSQGVCAGPQPDGSAVAKCDGKAGWVCTYPPGYESAQETLCDGFDNDCDGKTDEALLNPCGACGATPAESCNGIDDDCNGSTDDGVSLPTGTCGSAGVCQQAEAVCKYGKPFCVVPPTQEVTETSCDGLDNDCDGMTDEELGLGSACSAGIGACSGAGVRMCGPGGQVVCDGKLREAGKELCGNGLDDNCDGKTDEGFGVGDQCTAGLGVCRAVGKRMCSADRASAVCSVQPMAADAAERCGNGQDDDCDGATDEDDCKGEVVATGCTTAPAGPRDTWILLGLLLFACSLIATRRRRQS